MNGAFVRMMSGWSRAGYESSKHATAALITDKTFRLAMLFKMRPLALAYVSTRNGWPAMPGDLSNFLARELIECRIYLGMISLMILIFDGANLAGDGLVNFIEPFMTQAVAGDTVFAANAVLMAHVIIMVFPLLKIEVFWNQ